MKNYSGYIYQFVGGSLNGKTFLNQDLPQGLIKGFHPDYSPQRKQGGLVPCKELDNQPIFNGYLGPMRDGKRYIVDGKYKYEFECTEEEKADNKSVTVIRYESQRVYDALSR